MNSAISQRIQNESRRENICIVQLTRMGDILQTYRVSLSLKKYQPESKLYLVARKKIALPLMNFLKQCFEEVFLFDIEDMIDGAENNEDLIANISKILERINSYDFNTLVNLSWSKSSEYICFLIRADKKKGIVRDENNQVSIEDKWSQFVYATVMRGSYSPYNIVDIYKSILEIDKIITIPEVLKIINHKKIVIHPFASSSRKHWKYGKWVEVIYKTLKKNKEHEIIIVGEGEDECEKVERMLKNPVLDKYRDRIESKVGKMNINDLLNTLACAELFVGHDSFVSHLASLTDVPMVTLAMGTVKPHETAPYAPNVYIISPKTPCFPCFPDYKCDFYKCHADIPYQVVCKIIDLILSGNVVENCSLNKSMTAFLMSSVDIFKTSFEKSGFLKLDKVTKSNPSLKEAFMIFYRVAYLCFFEIPEEKIKIPELDRKAINDLKEVMEGLEYIYELYHFGKKYSKNIIEEIGSEVPCIDKIKSYSNKIDEIEKLQDLLSLRYPVLKPMIDFFVVNRRNVKGINAVEISEENFYSYHGSSIFVSMIYELCEKTAWKYEGYGFEKSKNV